MEIKGTFHLTAQRILLSLCLIALTSCRLVINTDATGHITSASGAYDCNQVSCAYPITEEVFETFTAIPANGYRFVSWTGVCRRAPTEICAARVLPLPEKFQQYDGDIALGAVFEPNNFRRAWYRDQDGDEYGAANQSQMAFERPEGYAGNPDDCDDLDAAVRPWAKEQNDDRDNDCDGEVDEGFIDESFFLDADDDGFGDPEINRLASVQPDGYVSNALDCNDSEAADHPEASEVIDGRDNDCDGSIDEGSTTLYRDVDGDGFGSPDQSTEVLGPTPGFVDNDRDCDDNNAAIFPEAREEFDSVDNDCDGDVDEGFTAREYFRDADGDGFGDPSSSVNEVDRPIGYVSNSTDNCVEIFNPRQTDLDSDGIGDACDPFTDGDRDGIQDSEDNCPANANTGQQDEDGDGRGDACDNINNLDQDNDGVNDEQDNCPMVYNGSQRDVDGDGRGDACDNINNLDRDNDGINDGQDNCPAFYNPDQLDSDTDGQGNACDSVDDRDIDTGNDSLPEANQNSGGDTSCGPSTEEQAMLEAVNAFRSQNRVCGSRGSFPAVSPLSWRCELKSAALAHSMDMASNNFFSHTGSDGESAGTRMNRANYRWSAWGENIAAGIPLSGVSAVMQAWIDSPGHCANLMSANFTNFGAAKYSDTSSTYDVYWTQVFGRPR